MRWWFSIVALAAGLAEGAPARAQSGWEGELALEIGLTQKCKVAYLSHVVERDVNGKKLVMAKAHCEDQRVFDAMRPDELDPFQFNECQPDAVKTC